MVRRLSDLSYTEVQLANVTVLQSVTAESFAKTNVSFAHANAAFTNANTVMISAQAAFTVANSSFLHANSGYTFANSISITANLAFDQANAAYDAANNAVTDFSPAFNQANIAYAQANAAYDAANNAVTDYSPALIQANTARVHANAAFASANAGQATANAAFLHANAAFANGNTVIQTAQSAFNQANISFLHANAAFASANSGQATGNAAQATANASYAFGNSAHSIANLAFTHANSAFSSSNSVNTYTNSTFVKLTATSQTITGDVDIVGNLTLSGNTFSIDATRLEVEDPLLYLAANNYTSDIVDIGFIANYVNATGQNVHTGLYREHENKEYYLFQGYDKEPINNHIGALSNNMTLAVLNADIKTSNIILGGANAILTIGASFNQANTARIHANAAFGVANTAVQNTASVTFAGNSAFALYPLFSADSYASSNLVVRNQSGFYETSYGTTANGWPVDTGSWQHALSVTHSNDANYYAMQLASSFYTQDWYLRNTNGSGTTGWSKIWHNNNDGAGSGLDADLLDGVSWGNVNTPINVSSGTSQPLQLTTSSSAPWHIALTRSDLGTSSKVFYHNSPYVGWYFEHNISIAGSTNWHSGNDGTGSGLDADTVDGLDVHTARNNEANKIVRTDANGYLQAGWINTPSGDNGTTALTKVYASSDDYIRTYTPANFRTVLDVPTRTGGSASGTWGISITGSAGSATTATTATNSTQLGGVALTNIPSGDNGAATSGATSSMNDLAQKSGYYWYNTPTGAPEATYTTWMTAMGHVAGDRYGWQLSQAYWSDALWTRRLTSNAWQTWRKILDSGNYNSYSPTLTGTGASGNWGINITGSAATFTSTTQNSQFNSLGVGTAGSGTAGEIRATNNITAYYSDKRLKKNIKQISFALDKVNKISGVTFQSNEEAAKYGYTDNKTQVGVIAQEIEAVLPEIVVPAPFDIDKDDDGNEYSKSGQNYKTVQYEKLVPLLIEAIKELSNQVEELKKKVENKDG